MRIIISHPTSNQFNRALLAGLLENQMLAEFHTSVAAFPGSPLYQLGGITALSDIRRRSFEPGLKRYTYSWPYHEAGRMMAGKLGISKLTRHETGTFCLDAVYEQLDKKVRKRLASVSDGKEFAVYSYEDGALHSFRSARQLGYICLYDLPIGYWRTARKLLQREKELWPQYSTTLTGLKDSAEKLAKKDQELAMADRIFVASSFTASTLEDYPGKLAPIEIIPYGFPPVVKARTYDNSTNRALKLLFVGGLSQRKGIANLFAAVRPLGKSVQLTVVGRKTAQACAALDAELARHTWIESLPYQDILSLMKQHDVLVFPSLFEGFGMVITEAMSQGTPVITTERTAGPDFIEHDSNGWLVEAGSTEALRDAIAKLIGKPQLIGEVGNQAVNTAAKRPWKVYGKELAEAIKRTESVMLPNAV